MATPVYDDEKTEAQRLEDLEDAFSAPDATESGSKKLEDAKALSKKEQNPDNQPADASSLDQQEQATDDTLGKGFTGNIPHSGKRGGWLNAKKNALIGSLIATIIAGVGAGGFLGFLNVFSLDNFLNSVEEKAFMRYQVNMDGRSSKWIGAYIKLRLADIDDPGTNFKDTDNVMFRSNRVDTNNPTYDWYRTLRTSSFEQDVFKKYGIQFTSVARREGNSIRFRPGKITIDTYEMPMGPLTEADALAFENGRDISQLNKYLDDFVDLEVLDNDKVARRAIKNVVNKEIKPWQWMRRRHLRKDIQNMTGVRNWRFFENTRNTLDEKVINIRDKFLLAALPDDTKSGRFMLCLFGVSDCKLSGDPADPANKTVTPDPNAPKEGGRSYTPEDGAEIGSPVDDGAAGEIAESAAKESTGEMAEGGAKKATVEGTALATRRILQSVMTKFNAGSGVIETVDALARINDAISTNKLSAFVSVAKSAQAIGIYTTLAIARDQIHTGEINPTEYNDFMSMIDGIGNNQIWSEAIAHDSTIAVAYAAAAVSNEEACTDEAIAAMTNTSYSPLCERFKIGSESNASAIENWWNNGLGGVLGPFFALYRSTPIPKAWSAISSVTSQILAPLGNLMTSALQSLGLQDNLTNALALVMDTAAKGLGAGPMIDNPVGPQTGLLAAEGAAATQESSMRFQGAAATTVTAQKETEARIATYLDEKSTGESLAYRYISLENPSSALSQQLFAFANNDTLSKPGSLFSSLFSAITSIPTRFSAFTSAADNTQTGYEIANMAGIKTYDFPSQCTDADPLTMTPQSATNADEMGIIPSSELTWDLVNNKDTFYARLYQSELSTTVADQVYDCAILDTSVRDAIGAQHGYSSGTDIDSAPSTASSTPATPNTSGSLPTGTAQQLAAQIVSNPNITFQTPQKRQYFQQVVATGYQTGPCSTVPIDTRLLGLILRASQDYKIVLGVFNTGHGCTGYQHQRGKAVDINGVAKLDGSATTGNNFHWNMEDKALVVEFYTYFADLMSKNGGGKIGQSQCFAEKYRIATPIRPAGVKFLVDNCNHLHVDTAP